jgi:hypothetical protein
LFDPASCINYTSGSHLLASEDDNLIDETYNIQDTITIDGESYFLVDEKLLYALNENHFNIFVEFYISEDGLNFTEFDWFEEFCISFNGRFPLLLDYYGQTVKAGPFKIKLKTPWEGEITYSMVSWNYLALFNTKTLKLRITIKDRALHTSNVLETLPFTLEGIRKPD